MVMLTYVEQFHDTVDELGVSAAGFVINFLTLVEQPDIVNNFLDLFTSAELLVPTGPLLAPAEKHIHNREHLTSCLSLCTSIVLLMQ
jgi:hypothetical protein